MEKLQCAHVSNHEYKNKQKQPKGKGREKNVRQTEVAKLLPKRSDKLLAHLGLLVVLLKLVALLVAGIAANGADIDHAVAELDKGAALDGDVEVGNVVQAKVDELLVLGLADPLDEAVGGQGLAELERRQAVLGEAKVKERRDGGAGRLADLLLLLDQVGAANEADGALLAEGFEEGEDFGGGSLRVAGVSWGSELFFIGSIRGALLLLNQLGALVVGQEWPFCSPLLPPQTNGNATAEEAQGVQAWCRGSNLPDEQASRCHRHQRGRWCP